MDDLHGMRTALAEFSHIDDAGASRMVDVSAKPITTRCAVATGRVIVAPETLQLIRQDRMKKGSVLEVARIAGIMGAKRTPDLIPLCHPLALTSVRVDLVLEGEEAIVVRAECATDAKTGVEMEALTAVSAACLTIYDMCKAVDRGIRITNIELESKIGGQSGDYRRPSADADSLAPTRTVGSP